MTKICPYKVRKLEQNIYKYEFLFAPYINRNANEFIQDVDYLLEIIEKEFKLPQMSLSAYYLPDENDETIITEIKLEFNENYLSS